MGREHPETNHCLRGLQALCSCTLKDFSSYSDIKFTTLVD